MLESLFRTKTIPLSSTKDGTAVIAPVIRHEIPAASGRPAIPAMKMERVPADPMAESQLAEYAELAATIGIMPPDLGIESFKALLLKHDIPIFSLAEVIAYMNDKARKESPHKSGWYWRALRKKDQVPTMKFGTPAERHWNGKDHENISPASDYYNGAAYSWDASGNGREIQHRAHAEPYDRTIPLHAVRRIALIESEYKGPLSFLVSDYALAPAIPHPDPFLMAVIPNLNVANGTGRFVIDFWDEPGFGIDKMLK